MWQACLLCVTHCLNRPRWTRSAYRHSFGTVARCVGYFRCWPRTDLTRRPLFGRCEQQSGRIADIGFQSRLTQRRHPRCRAEPTTIEPVARESLTLVSPSDHLVDGGEQRGVAPTPTTMSS